MAKSRKNSPLDEALASIRKDYGDTSLVLLGDDPSMDVERISSGNAALDIALFGGYGRGCIVELFGAPSAGKSSLAMLLAAQVQSRGGTVAYLDVEHGMNKDLAIACGVDIDQLLFSQPGTGEETLEICERLMVPGMELIVVDSVAAMTPRAEIEGDHGDAHVALQARLMSQGLRKLTSSLSHGIIVLFINQVRQTIGSMPFGPQTTTSGGRALPYYASIRCEVVKGKQIKRGEEVLGHEVKVKVVKNRFGAPHRTAEFDLLYDRGISNASGVVKLAEKAGLLIKSGNWYTDTLTGEKVGNGYLATVDYYDDNTEQLQRLVEALNA